MCLTAVCGGGAGGRGCHGDRGREGRGEHELLPQP